MHSKITTDSSLKTLSKPLEITRQESFKKSKKDVTPPPKFETFDQYYVYDDVGNKPVYRGTRLVPLTEATVLEIPFHQTGQHAQWFPIRGKKAKKAIKAKKEPAAISTTPKVIVSSLPSLTAFAPKPVSKFRKPPTISPNLISFNKPLTRQPIKPSFHPIKRPIIKSITTTSTGVPYVKTFAAYRPPFGSKVRTSSKLKTKPVYDTFGVWVPSRSNPWDRVSSGHKITERVGNEPGSDAKKGPQKILVKNSENDSLDNRKRREDKLGEAKTKENLVEKHSEAKDFVEYSMVNRHKRRLS